MKKRTSLVTAAVAAFALAVIPATSALAEYGAGASTCSSTWSYTWANSTQSLLHVHTVNGNEWRSTTKPAGVSNYYGFYKRGFVTMELSTSGNFSGEVYGCHV